MRGIEKMRRVGNAMLSFTTIAALFFAACGRGTTEESRHPISVTLLNVGCNYPLNDMVIETPPPLLMLEFEVENKTNLPIELVDSCFSIRLSCSSTEKVAVELTSTITGIMKLDPYEKSYRVFRAFYLGGMPEHLLQCNKQGVSGAWIEELTRQVTVVYGCGKGWEFECERLDCYFSENLLYELQFVPN